MVDHWEGKILLFVNYSLLGLQSHSKSTENNFGVLLTGKLFSNFYFGMDPTRADDKYI